MKKIKKICLFICTVFMLSCIFSACDNIDNNSNSVIKKVEQEIIGTWSHTEVKRYSTSIQTTRQELTFTTNNRVTYKYIYTTEYHSDDISDFRNEVYFTGTYEIKEIDGDLVAVATITDTNMSEIYKIGGETDIDLFYNEDSGVLTVRYVDNFKKE